MDIALLTTVAALLFVLIGLAEPVASRLSLPFSVMLASLGILIGGGALFLLHTDITDALNPLADTIIDLPIRSNVFLYVFLPTLIFQTTLDMNIRRMLDDWVPILTLAVVAVLVATLTIGYALSWVSTLPLVVCLLVGAIVSTTDPSAVVGIFRALSTPQRLARIIEGESLLNDAAAIALFGLFISYVIMDLPAPGLGQAIGSFPMLFIGGAVAGWLIAFVAIEVMTRIHRFELAQISISVAVPYLSYIVAEEVFHASGVIGVVAAGLTMNFAGPGRILPSAWAKLRAVWDLLSHWSGALIFVLAALLIPRLLDDVHLIDLGLIMVVVAAALVSRAIILFGLMPLLTMLRVSPVVEVPYRVAILWGGLRGAVTLALALAVTENPYVDVAIKREVGILATGFTLWTLMVQGTTLSWVISRLRLDKLSSLDMALSKQVIAVALQEVREDLKKTTENFGMSRETLKSEAYRFKQRVDRAVQAAEAEDNLSILDRDRVTLGLLALAGHEREEILDYFRIHVISARLSEQMLFDADRLIEATRTDGRMGYQRAAKRNLRYGPPFRVAALLRNRFGISGPLANVTADRVEMLLAKRLILRDLGIFVDGRIRRIHGDRVAEILHDLVNRRSEQLDAAIEGLRLQYPDYTDKLERRYFRRLSLRLEEREFDALRDDGLIGEELHGVLMQSIAQRRGATALRPHLDLVPANHESLPSFPLFADLGEDELQALLLELDRRYVNSGKVVVQKGSVSRSVFFVASGVIELEVGGQVKRLERGKMFGAFTALTGRPSQGQATALTPTSLLELDDRGLRDVLKRSPTLRRALLDNAPTPEMRDELLKVPELASG